MSRSDDCASNIHEFCSPCDCECHNEGLLYLDKKELKLLHNFLEHQYIDYENLELLQLVRKISTIVEDDQ